MCRGEYLEVTLLPCQLFTIPLTRFIFSRYKSQKIAKSRGVEMSVDEQIRKLSTEESFRAKNQALAMVLHDQLAEFATNLDHPAPFAARLEIYKSAVKMGGLEPKEAHIPQGAGFSIKFVFSGAQQAVTGVTIEASSDDAFLDGERPAYLKPTDTARVISILSPQEK